MRSAKVRANLMRRAAIVRLPRRRRAAKSASTVPSVISATVPNATSRTVPSAISVAIVPSVSGGFKPRPRPADAAEEPGERIAKRLARAGLASRRDAEELIAAGRVKVNGRALSSPAFNVMPGDIIHLDGMEIPPIERTRLFLFHKPAGVVTTNRDPEGRKTVFDVLPADLPRLMTIGRLDINTEGLLLLTNDGGLSRVLELPATGWLRRYRVRVHGKVEESALAGLREGIAVDGVFYGAIEATLDREQGTNAWLTLGLREGKNREVRNILGSLGLDVTRLIRISYGPFQLDDLREGHVLEIKGRVLRDQLGERLVEESGANFDAEITKPFSNKPVRRGSGTGSRTRAAEIHPRRRTPPDRRGRSDQEPQAPRGQPRRGARQTVDKSRQKALASAARGPSVAASAINPAAALATSLAAASAASPWRGKKSEREQRPIEPPGQRKANVWMAPGARPIGKGRAEADAAKAADAKARKASFKPSYGKPATARKAVRQAAWRASSGGGGDRPRSGPKGPRARVDGSSAVSFAGVRWRRPAPTPSARRPTARARPSSTCWRIALPKAWTARACSTCSPAPARSASKRCRAARPTASSSRNRPKAAA